MICTKIVAEEAHQAQRRMRSECYESQLKDSELSAAKLLAPPSVTGALSPNSLLPLSVLENGLDFDIPKWQRLLPGDVVTVYWNDIRISEISHSVSDPTQEIFPIPLKLKKSHLSGDGIFLLRYRVTSASGSYSDSSSLAITIDRRPPNEDNVPAAIKFPEEVLKNGLTLEYLNTHHNEVIATVPAYKNMEAGQTVHVLWGGMEIQKMPVSQQHVDQQSVPISISGQVIGQYGEGTQSVSYYLTSRAGFDGRRSIAVSIQVVRTPAPANLRAPNIPLASGGHVVDLDDATKGVSIFIPKYDNFLQGDVVYVQWGSTALPGVPVGTFPVNVVAQRGTIVNEGTHASLTIGYKISRGGFEYKSKTVTISTNVDYVGPVNPDPNNPVNSKLKAPVVTGGSGASVINTLGQNDNNKPAKVSIPFYSENVKPEQIVNVYWGFDAHEPAATYKVTADDILKKKFPDIIVDAATVSKTPDGPLKVYYAIGPKAGVEPRNENISEPQTVSVLMHVPINLSPASFPEANKAGWLLTSQVSEGVKIHVEPYGNIEIGDSVILTWQAYSTINAAHGSDISGTSYSSSPQKIDAVTKATGLDFVVPKVDVDPIKNATPSRQGSGTARYTVVRGERKTDSTFSLVKIDLGQP